MNELEIKASWLKIQVNSYYGLSQSTNNKLLDDYIEIKSKIRERVLYLIDLCPNLPRNIRKKYCKDLVDLIDDGFTVFED